MTSELTQSTNVLLLNFVDFRTMTLLSARSFYKKLAAADDAEIGRAFALLQEQTQGVFLDHWLTHLAIAMMTRLKLKYTVARRDLTTGELSDVRQN